MAALTPAELKTKGAGTTLWLYNSDDTDAAISGTTAKDDTKWTRLAGIKDLKPGQITAESQEDSYLDDPDADWKGTAQGEKSAGQSTFTLAWKPGEKGQRAIVSWFDSGAVRAYRILHSNGTVDVFKGWVSGIGKTITAKDTVTVEITVTNTGRPRLAEDAGTASAGAAATSVGS